MLLILLISMNSIFLKAQESGWYPAFLKPVVEAVLSEGSSKRVLDIGTGPGTLLSFLIEKDSSLQLTGIDIDTSMIDEAKRRLKHKNVSFEYEKINAPLDFEDAQFDVVTFCSVLFLVDEETKNLLLNEALRVLKPNGKIIVLTPSGQRSFLSAFKEVWNFPSSKNNWTYLIWKTLTKFGGRKWQKQKWLAAFAEKNGLEYTSSLTFNNNASIETITKTIKSK
jgi:ubiquinone/menaquinone biosynthesis C-methylase UbiE